MKLFFDTSSLLKLYHKEKGTDELIELFTTYSIGEIFISEITIIEFSSAVWKKCRKREIDESTAKLLIRKFDSDLPKYSLVVTDGNLLKKAKALIGKHWKMGLRTLDSIQLASVLEVKSKIQRFITADIVLGETAAVEGLTVI